jgi:protein-disulfide isomerase
MKRYLPFALILIVALAAVGSGVAIFRKQKTDLAAVEIVDSGSGKPGAKPAHIRGEGRAAVTIEEFGDFQCPPCGNLSPILAKIEHEYGTRLRVVFRQYPLSVHAHAALAARAAEAAGLQDRFWEMHDALYRTQNAWSTMTDARPSFVEYAGSIGLDRARFEKDLDSEQVIARVEADQARANSLGVSKTPTLFLNNTLLPQAGVNEQGLRAAIDAALAGKPLPSSSSTTK